MSFGVGGDYRVADAAQRDSKDFAAVRGRELCAIRAASPKTMIRAQVKRYATSPDDIWTVVEIEYEPRGGMNR